MRTPEEQAAIERLQEIDKLATALEQLIWEAKEFRKDGLGAMRYDTPRVRTSPRGDAIPDRVARAEAYTKRIMDLEDRYRDARMEIIEEIRRVRRPLHCEILMARYVRGWDFDRIARHLSYSYSHVTKEHSRALMDFWKTNMEDKDGQP